MQLQAKMAEMERLLRGRRAGDAARGDEDKGDGAGGGEDAAGVSGTAGWCLREHAANDRPSGPPDDVRYTGQALAAPGYMVLARTPTDELVKSRLSHRGA